MAYTKDGRGGRGRSGGTKQGYGDRTGDMYEKPSRGAERSYGDKPAGAAGKPYGGRGKGGYDKPSHGSAYDAQDGRPSRGTGRQKTTPINKRPARQAPPPPREPMVVEAAFEGEEALPRENLLAGRNPIREALKSGRDIERLLVAKGELSGSAREIVAVARDWHIVVQVVDRTRLDAITQGHQGMIAFASAFRYGTVEDMLALAKEKNEDPLLVVLDGVTDPHNLGAIIRSAECAGAHGVIVPERRAVGLTPAAVKASAGAVEYLPVARVGNLSRFLDGLKEQGVWIIAADMEGEPYASVDLTGPVALVIGGEGGGVSRLVMEQADRRVALPVKGHIDSLNASVAAGVLLYEIRRQRG